MYAYNESIRISRKRVCNNHIDGKILPLCSHFFFEHFGKFISKIKLKKTVTKLYHPIEMVTCLSGLTSHTLKKI
jgi:hypothetical protein